MTGQQLKNSILQLAIQGKLVPQNPDDEPASELLKRIREEKERLVKEKKIKKEKPLAEISEDEKPFEIPEGWVWCRLNDIYNFIDYRGKTPTKINSGVFLVTATNIKQGFLDFTSKAYISESEYRQRQSRGITQKGDLLFTTEAPMGHIAQNNLDVCSCGQRIITFQSYLSVLNNRIFCNFIQSPFFQEQISKNASGMTATGIKGERVKKLIIPLPPLPEQHRIVQKIEELMTLVDEYDKAQKELNTLNTNLPEALKKSILQEAIQGKLGTNNPDDEPASELLKRIREEKAKLVKEKKLKVGKYLYEITDDEISIDIPENWIWVRMQELCDFPVPQKRKEPHICMDAAFLRGKSQGEIKQSGNYVEKGTKIILVDGENSGEVFSTPIDGYMGSTFKELFIASELDIDYISYIFYLLKQRMRDNKRGAAIPHLDKELFFGSLIPLPPLQEQHRIVEKLNNILPKLKNL